MNWRCGSWCSFSFTRVPLLANYFRGCTLPKRLAYLWKRHVFRSFKLRAGAQLLQPLCLNALLFAKLLRSHALWEPFIWSTELRRRHGDFTLQRPVCITTIITSGSSPCASQRWRQRWRCASLQHAALYAALYAAWHRHQICPACITTIFTSCSIAILPCMLPACDSRSSFTYTIWPALARVNGSSDRIDLFCTESFDFCTESCRSERLTWQQLG